MKKIYALVTIRGKQYAAHISPSIKFRFNGVLPISREQYREARASGVPSWGEYQTVKEERGLDPFIF